MAAQKSLTAIVGATIIDAKGGKPISDGVLLIEDKRISAVGDRSLPVAAHAKKIDAKGKFVIPGLMNANLHLQGAHFLEGYAQHWGAYEDLIAEAAQVALKSGLTTVFDTWGPRRFLMNVRDKINAGQEQGARIFCAGNIIGFDGPFSVDFMGAAAAVASANFVNKINAIWVENVGRHLMWLTPEQTAKEVGDYIAKGIDFIKYGANDHAPGAFLSFSTEAQTLMVREAHRAGITAQSHIMSVEGLRTSIEAGCDLITHCNITGPTPIPESTLEMFVKKDVGAVVFPWTDKGFEWLQTNCPDVLRTMVAATDINARNLIKHGAPLLLANDAMLVGADLAADPNWGRGWMGAPEELNIGSISNGHFVWFKAMEEKGCEPMRMLQAATKNIAEAYGKDEELGTLEPGKYADLLILDKDPLANAENYRSIHIVMKEGVVVDRDALPLKPMLTQPAEQPVEELAHYKPFISSGRFPMCPTCIHY